MRASAEYSSVPEQMPVPVSFSCLGGDTEWINYPTRPLSIFQNGFVITSPCRLRLGSWLVLRILLPPQISGSKPRRIRCAVCVKAGQTMNGGTLGYKVELVPPLLS